MQRKKILHKFSNLDLSSNGKRKKGRNNKNMASRLQKYLLSTLSYLGIHQGQPESKPLPLRAVSLLTRED